VRAILSVVHHAIDIMRASDLYLPWPSEEAIVAHRGTLRAEELQKQQASFLASCSLLRAESLENRLPVWLLIGLIFSSAHIRG
jgi:hypothetical protein